MRRPEQTLASRIIAPLLGAALAAYSGPLLASGSELLPGGTRSVARGGAVHARPEDPMVLLHNPAGLAMLTDNQLMLDLDLVVHDMCVDPYGYYGWGVYSDGVSEFGDQTALDDPEDPTVGATYATTPLGRVCNSAPSFPVPQLAWAGRITDEIGLGAGLIAPTVIPGMQFGGADGTVQTPYGPRPTPTRYTLVKQEVTHALGASFGAAYRFIPQVSVGAALQVLMVRAQAKQVQNEASGTGPASDWLATVTTQDFFVPAVTFSVHSQPFDELNLMSAFRFSDDIRGSGDVVYETNTYRRGATSGPIPFENDPIALSEVTVRLPYQFNAGARYAGLLPGEHERGDPLGTELWDIEVDFGYTFAARTSQSTVRLGEDATVITREASGAQGQNTVKVEDVSAFEVDRHLKDVYTVRVGGSYSVLPRRLAVLAGGFYESRGVELAYVDIDTFAFQRVGVGAGVLLRLGAFDLRAAYGHVFSETLEIAPPPHQPVEDATLGDPRSGFDQRVGGAFDGTTRRGGVVLRDPSAPNPRNADAVAARTQKSAVSTAAQPERVINAGRYTAAFNILSVGVVYHF